MPIGAIVRQDFEEAHSATGILHDDFITACTRWTRLSLGLGWEDDRGMLGIIQSLKDKGRPIGHPPLNSKEILDTAEQAVSRWYPNSDRRREPDLSEKRRGQAIFLIGKFIDFAKKIYSRIPVTASLFFYY